MHVRDARDAGSPKSRATIAPCESTPPVSITRPRACTNSGSQAGSVEGQKRIYGSTGICALAGCSSTQAAASAVPAAPPGCRRPVAATRPVAYNLRTPIMCAEGAEFAMNEVTLILSAIEQGDPHVAAQLLPLVYDELRKLAAQKLAQESAGQTLQATALVHEVYLRLVDVAQAQHWNSRGHFFAAAAEAMRRILIENARSKGRRKRGGDWRRVDLENLDLVTSIAPDELLTLDEAIERLAKKDSVAANLVKIRYYAGLTLDQAAQVAGMSIATAYRHWAYARAWLHCALLEDVE